MADRDEIDALLARADDLAPEPVEVERVEIAAPPPEVFEGEVITHPEINPVLHITERCVLCGREFRMIDGHECRARVIRAGSLFDRRRI